MTTPTQANAPTSQKHRAKVLVVDDEVAMREFEKTVLEELGHEVIEAANGTDAMARAREHRPDLALLDIKMPGLSGIDVCKQLRADPSTRDIRVIVVTGIDARAALEESLVAGADDFLQKPFDSLELAVRVRSMLRVRNIADVHQRVEAYIKNMQMLRQPRQKP